MRRFRTQKSVLQYAREQWTLHVASLFPCEDDDLFPFGPRFRNPRCVRLARPGELDDSHYGKCTEDEVILARDLHEDGDEEVIDTVAHEIAHFIAGLCDGDDMHGEEWRKRAEALGCRDFHQYEEERREEMSQQASESSRG